MTDINATGMKRAALINDLSCIGKCSLSVALPIVSAFGVEGVALPTAVLSTHTGGFENYVIHDMTPQMRAFAAHWKRMNAKFDCVYTGFFSSVEQIDIAREFVRDFGGEDCLVIVDPVLGDNGALYDCFTAEYIAAMRALAAGADVITPNHTEAALLAGLPMDADADTLISTLGDTLGVRNIIITGMRRGGEVGYEARLGGRRAEFYRPWQSTVMHGTGDVFTSALCGELMRGRAPEAAFTAAAEFCDECIQETVRLQPGHWYGLAFEEILKRRMSL